MKTALEWFYEKYISEMDVNGEIHIDLLNKFFDEAKQMEKEKELKQWSDTWTSGYFSGWDNCMKKYNFKSEE
jgi:hypothetical protein